MLLFMAPLVEVFDFILLPLFMRRLLRMVARSVPMVPLFMVPVPLFMVPVPLFIVPVVPLFIVPVLGVVDMVPGVCDIVPEVVVPGVVWAKAALAQRAKAAARKRDVDFIIKEVSVGGKATATAAASSGPYTGLLPGIVA